jgi:hypothetical protein
MRKIFFTFTIFIVFCCQFAFAQTLPQPAASSAGRFPIGERLTYNVSFANYPNAAYAETYVASEGKYGTRDAVYLQGKLITTELVNAVFFSIDETRQTLVAADTGMPLYCKKIFGESGLGREKVTDFKGAAAGFDWLSAIYQLRFVAATSGSLAIQEGDEVFQATYRMVGKAHNKTAAGEFDTIVLEVQNPTFPGLQIYLSNDEQRLPVVITYKHPKGLIRAELAGIQELAPEPVAANTPPQTNPTPAVVVTPKPKATPTPYINNQPLAEDLPFDLGETLTFKLSRLGDGNSFGTMVVQAKERRQFTGKDSLLLNAAIQQITDSSSFFAAGDTIKSYVEPDSLLPQRTEIVFRGALSQFNQTLQFEQAMGKVMDGKGVPYDVPVGTHDILSLAYAIRSFNLKDVKSNKGPGGDIRVALFTGDGPQVLTILSQPEETIEFQGKKLLTQVVFANIGNSTVKLWLSKDQDRLPLRLSITNPVFSFNADLISVTQNPPAAEPAAEQGVNPPGMPNPILVVNPRPISDIKKP